MNWSELCGFIFLLQILHYGGGKGIFVKATDCGGPIRTITVSQSGEAQFKTIQSAIDTLSTTTNNTQWIRIQISPGVYREHIFITTSQNCIYLEGAGMNSTIIEMDGHMSPTSPTFDSRADYVVAKGISFKNTYNNPGGLGRQILPAEAARIMGDKCAFYECAFLGVQDTLDDHSGRHYFHKCYIQGGIDFIFGDGQSIYEECTMEFAMGKDAPPGRGGVITAQKRDSDKDSSGFVLKKCTITGKGKGLCGLGRGYRGRSRVIIANSFLGDVVAPKGWDAWNGAGHEENLIYAEEGCYGPGADMSKRVPWMKHLSGSELDQYVNISFIDQEGWIPKLPIGPSKLNHLLN